MIMIKQNMNLFFNVKVTFNITQIVLNRAYGGKFSVPIVSAPGINKGKTEFLEYICQN